MAVDMFIKIDGIKGESKDSKHKGEIDVLAWSWGLSNSGTFHMGGGGGAGKANVQDLSFTHFVDTASPNLALACCNGKHFEEAVLTVRKAGEKPLDYLMLTMNDIIITSVSPGGASGDELITENVTLNFAKYTLSYQPQDNKGAKAGGAVEIEYDIAKNV